MQQVTCSCIFVKPFKGLSFHPNENETDFTVSGFCAPWNWCLPASHISILQDFIQKKKSEIAFSLLRNLEGNLRLIFSKSFDLKYSNTDCFIKVLSKDIFLNKWFYLSVPPLPPIVWGWANTEKQGFPTRKWKPVVILTGLEVTVSCKVNKAVKSPVVTTEEIGYLMCWYFFPAFCS